MKNPLEKLSRAKKTQEAAMQRFGKNLIRKYEAAKRDWQESPRYKRALENAAYEGSASLLNERKAKTPKKVIAKPRKK